MNKYINHVCVQSYVLEYSVSWFIIELNQANHE